MIIWLFVYTSQLRLIHPSLWGVGQKPKKKLGEFPGEGGGNSKHSSGASRQMILAYKCFPVLGAEYRLAKFSHRFASDVFNLNDLVKDIFNTTVDFGQ